MPDSLGYLLKRHREKKHFTQLEFIQFLAEKQKMEKYLAEKQQPTDPGAEVTRPNAKG